VYEQDARTSLYRVSARTSGGNLKSKYRELLKDWNDWDKQELEKVIAFLDSHDQEELKQIAEPQMFRICPR
jgi:hypothetical protein